MANHKPLRRWPSIEPTMSQCLVFAGNDTVESSLWVSKCLFWRHRDQQTCRGQSDLSVRPSPCLESDPIWYGLSLSLQAQDTHTRLVQCWASLADAGPTLNRPCVSVSCRPLITRIPSHRARQLCLSARQAGGHLRCWPSIAPTLSKSRLDYGCWDS